MSNNKVNIEKERGWAWMAWDGMVWVGLGGGEPVSDDAAWGYNYVNSQPQTRGCTRGCWDATASTLAVLDDSTCI